MTRVEEEEREVHVGWILPRNVTPAMVFVLFSSGIPMMDQNNTDSRARTSSHRITACTSDDLVQTHLHFLT